MFDVTVYPYAADMLVFADEVHAPQLNKYTGEPYLGHLMEVAGYTATFLHALTWLTPDEAIAVAIGHDCMEDCGVTYETLYNRFNGNIAQGIWWLSDLEVGNRAFRENASVLRLGNAPADVQGIKCGDSISNNLSIAHFDPKFATVYLPAKGRVLEAMTLAPACIKAFAMLKYQKAMMDVHLHFQLIRDLERT